MQPSPIRYLTLRAGGLMLLWWSFFQGLIKSYFYQSAIFMIPSEVSKSQGSHEL